ncbi:uncharacterized protein LOC124644324 [Helicoverpa zea]|uniref:uncharacterized protein LOC124644324 n=1 Tax=Helicoverpa zea TaxID=7113 RepID=UPI001F5867C6|nr:uncharacterized protein LOC124644324 [Helicoverpa zea]
MEFSTETWRIKHPRHWIPVKHGKADEKEKSPCKLRAKTTKDTEKEEKRKTALALCFLCKRKKFIPVPKEPSLLSLATTLNDSCCQCCRILACYLKEVIQCLFCMINCRIPCMQFEELFCDLLDATGCMFTDFFKFIRAFLKVCVGTKD